MKKILFIALLAIGLNSQAQVLIDDFKEQSISYNFTTGNDSSLTDNFIGYSDLSFQIDAAGLDAADATIQIQKTNNEDGYLNIVGAVVTLPAGASTNYIEIANVKNAKYRVFITVNSVTAGILTIDIIATK